MYKLAIRRQRFFFLGTLLLCFGLVIFLPSHTADKVVKMPLLALLLAEIVIAAAFSSFCYRRTPAYEIIKAATIFLAICFAVGTIGNLTLQIYQPLSSGEVLISLIQLVIMNIGGFASTYALCELKPGPNYTPMEAAAADNVRTSKRRGYVSATRLPAQPASEDLNVASDSPVSLSAPSSSQTDKSAIPPGVASPSSSALESTTSRTGKEASNAAPTRPQRFDQPSSQTEQRITNQRIQVHSKRNTTTFTKLQALSVTHRELVPTQAGEETPGLKSILDRLDEQADEADEANAANEAAAVVAALEAAKTTEQLTTMATSQPVSKEQLTPTNKDALKRSNADSKLLGVVSRHRLPALNPQTESLAAASQLTVASHQGIADALSKQTVENRDTKTDELSDTYGFPSAKEDDLPALIKTTTTGPTPPSVDESGQPIAEPELAQPEPAQPEPAQPEPAQSEPAKLFEANLDDQVDEAFARLVPHEAQKEVNLPSTAKTDLIGADLDNQVDQAFSALVPPEAQREVSSVSSPQSTTDQKEEPQPAKGLFASALSDEIDDLFAQIAPEEAHRSVSDRQKIITSSNVESDQISFAPPSSKVEVSSFASNTEQPPATEETEYSIDGPMVNPVTNNMEVKEFGRLSAKSASPKQQAPTGTMKTIGKLLIDVQLIENIIKTGASEDRNPGFAGARIISAAKGEGIKVMLGKIDNFQDVAGCLIVGHDGLVIASTLGSAVDKDAVGALSSALLNTNNLTTLKLEIGQLKQIVMLTEYFDNNTYTPLTTILTDVEVGVLAVFLNTQRLNKLDEVMDLIHSTVYG